MAYSQCPSFDVLVPALLEHGALVCPAPAPFYASASGSEHTAKAQRMLLYTFTGRTHAGIGLLRRNSEPLPATSIRSSARTSHPEP